MSGLNVVVVAAKGIVFEGSAHSVIVPGKNGILGIYPGHTKLMSLLKAGNIEIRKGKESVEEIPIASGLVQINRESIDILINEK